jgi:glutaminyl-tRNA synthetase
VPLVIDNVDDDHEETLSIPHWPREIDKDDAREVPFTKRLFVERDDVRLDPPDDFYRLAPGAEVRLRGGYFVTCTEVVTDDAGDVVEVRGTIDPDTRDSTAPDGRSPDGTIHWVSAAHAVPFEARLYDRLFDVPVPDGGDTPFTDHLNPDSLQVCEAVVEPSVRDLPEDARVQFERQGYFWPDPHDSAPDALVYNQIVPLRDTWAAADEEAREEALAEARRRKERQKEAHRQRSIQNKKDPVDLLSGDQRARFDRYHDAWSVDREDAAIIAGDDALAAFYEETVDAYDAPQPIANWVVNELLAETKDRPIAQLPFDASQFARLVELSDEDVLSSRAAREVFGTMMKDGTDPDAVVEAEGLRQIDDVEALRDTVRTIIEAHPGETARYRDGATNLLGFFMGQVMQATRGTANPQRTRDVLQDELAE